MAQFMAQNNMIKKLLITIALLALPFSTFAAPSLIWQGGTGTSTAVGAGQFLFGGGNNLRFLTSAQLLWDNTLNKLTFPNASTTAVSVSGQSYFTGLLSAVNALFSGTLGVTGHTTLTTASSTNMTASGFINTVTLNATGQTTLANASTTNMTVSGFLTSYEERGFSVASTTPDRLGNKFATATTTWHVINLSRPATVSKFYCKTGTGTVRVRIGDGTNFTQDVSCTSSGAEVTTSSNNTFTAREDIVIQIGTSASSPSWVVVTPTILEQK